MGSSLWRQHGATAAGRAAAAFELFLDLRSVTLFEDQAIVEKQLFPRANLAQRLDEDAAAVLLGLAVGLAGVVDPAGRVAVVLAVDDVLVIDVEVEGVVGVGRVVRMAAQRLLPTDDLALVFDDGFAFGQWPRREHAPPVDARAPHLDAAAGSRGGG